MHKKFGRRMTLCLSLLAVLLLTGCRFSASVDELYTLPQMPGQYADLESKIKILLDEGAEYAAPSSGSNLQALQMTDLDGDGQEEALLFIRHSTQEHPLRIYVFCREGEGYRECATILGNGSSIYSVHYADLTGDGISELLVGWRSGTESQMLSVYTMRDLTPEERLNVPYTRYYVTEDGKPVIFHTDRDGACLADCYTVEDGGTFSIASTLRLSCTAAELAAGQVISGKTPDGVNALFVTGLSADFNTMSVDVVTRDGGTLHNASANTATGYTDLRSAFIGLYPTDINGDGATEIPVSLSGTDVCGGSAVIWYSCDAEGNTAPALTTYHALADGWYLTMPEQMQTGVSVARVESESDMAVSFRQEEDGTPHEFLRIYAFGGDNRALRAYREERFVLRTLSQTIYAGEFVGTGGLHAGITEETIQNAFHLIETEWFPGAN